MGKREVLMGLIEGEIKKMNEDGIVMASCANREEVDFLHLDTLARSIISRAEFIKNMAHVAKGEQ